jgi:hypothetical protein
MALETIKIQDQDFLDLLNLGLKPIPLIWNTETKAVISHCIAHSEITNENYTVDTYKNTVKSLTSVNGIAIKLFSPFGCIDFDLKNTSDKKIFDKWLQSVSFLDEDILSKICIERTRNAGYHVYIKYSKLSNKISLARETQGEEVIAIYTGGTLSYCDPTPGYDMYHNEFQDLEELTNDQYDILVSCALLYDKYVNKDGEESGKILAEYPLVHENVCLQFDEKITDEAFEHLLNEIDLYPVLDYKYHKKDHFLAYLRKGSKARLSAKVYLKSKKLLIFSASITGFPHWADRKDKDDHSWVITPSRLIYYKNDKDWTLAIEEIMLIADSTGLEITESKPAVVEQESTTVNNKLRFPIEDLPIEFQDVSSYHPFPKEMMASAFLSTVSILIGNSCVFEANPGFKIKPILFLAIVASPGSSKSPASKISLSFLNELDERYFDNYQSKMKIYKEEYSLFKNQKKGDPAIPEPQEPKLRQIQILDATIETTINILSTNDHGCLNNSDELSGFLKRMTRYGDSDEVQKWLQLFDALPVRVQRISREIDAVKDPFCGIFGTIQPGVLAALSAGDNRHNGFFHRFLFTYPDPEPKPDFDSYTIPEEVTANFKRMLQEIYDRKDNRVTYRFTDEALTIYKDWFRQKNTKYNASDSDDIKGIISKYQTYCLKFALIMEVIHNRDRVELKISEISMERAIRLTEYFLANINKALKILAPESPVDKLSGKSLLLYKALESVFTAPKAIEAAAVLKITPANTRVYLQRWVDGKLITSEGTQRTKVYSKIYE